jgi:hypothetical protein
VLRPRTHSIREPYRLMPIEARAATDLLSRFRVTKPLGRDADRLAAELGVDLPREVVAGLVAAWSQLFGLVSFELFGQFENMISARGQFFDRAVERLAEAVGFTVPAP